MSLHSERHRPVPRKNFELPIYQDAVRLSRFRRKHLLCSISHSDAHCSLKILRTRTVGLNRSVVDVVLPIC